MEGDKGTSHAFSGQETKCRGSRADVCCLRNSKKKKEKKEKRKRREGEKEEEKMKAKR